MRGPRGRGRRRSRRPNASRARPPPGPRASSRTNSTTRATRPLHVHGVRGALHAHDADGDQLLHPRPLASTTHPSRARPREPSPRVRRARRVVFRRGLDVRDCDRSCRARAASAFLKTSAACVRARRRAQGRRRRRRARRRSAQAGHAPMQRGRRGASGGVEVPFEGQAAASRSRGRGALSRLLRSRAGRGRA